MLGIFIYGCFVFAIVAAAVGLIAWGIRAERRDREQLAQDFADREPNLRAIASQVAGDAHGPAA